MANVLYAKKTHNLTIENYPAHFKRERGAKKNFTSG